MDDELQARNYRISWRGVAIMAIVVVLAYASAAAYGASAVALIAGTTGGYLFARITGW